MFPKRFRYSFKKGLPKKTKSFPSFNLRYDKNDLGEIRVAVVVSKRVHKHANIRNRVKRKLFGHLENRINKNKGFDLTFFIKKRALELESMADEVESVADLLEEI